jgi:predicted RNA binding protein YcfA (HicA-like mRNA interferase family)
MSKKQKLLKRLLSVPADFTFDETCALLEAMGFSLSNSGKTSGSSVKFKKANRFVMMHKPHPQNTLKRYQIDNIIRQLKEAGLI